MSVSTCVNCHQPVAPTDDICENCGAVLQPLSAVAPNGTASPAPPAAYTSVGANGATLCPNCKQPLSPGDEVCENCGVVLASFVAPPGIVANSAPAKETCPQCHAPRVSGVKFCNQCGYRYETATSPAASSAISQSHAPVQTTQLVTGSVLNGKYSIVKEIGAGGMGTVYLADATHGSADIIPTPQQVASAFSAAFSEMRKTAITNTRLSLWAPNGVTIKHIQQVYPNIAPLDLQADTANPRQQIVTLGSFAAGEQHEYLCDLEIPIYAPGQQFLMLRPGMKYFTAKTGEQEEKSTNTGWVFAQWTEDMNLAALLEPHIAHYINQEELSQRINDGQAALAAGDRDRATRLLGEALEISERTGNERMTRLLNTIVLRDAKGTLRLNQQADAVAKKTPFMLSRPLLII